jgi:uncharacterized protein YqjF (DUF2071 family)
MTPTSFEQSGNHDRLVGRQRWRDLLFLHQPISVQRLRYLVPAPLTIDTFNQEAWITLIPFAIFDSRPIGAPPRLALDFLEINLRTYVRSPAGEPGIYFFSLEASSWLSVAGARLTYALPYFPAAMSSRKDPDGTIHFQSIRRVGGHAALDMSWRPGPVVGNAAPGSLDHFLIERYVLFAQRGRRLYRARVRHQPYPVCTVSFDSGRETLLAAAELPPLSLPPLLAHGSPGVDVEIFWRQRYRARPT